jgi:hypothetical protein
MTKQFCTICTKKINSIYISHIYTCKCKKIYCSEHMHNHMCEYDYKTECKIILKQQLQKIIPKKFEEI